jgi:thiol-disulfide isomerase/thioredoxin
VHETARLPLRAALVALAVLTVPACSGNEPAVTSSSESAIATNVDTTGRGLPTVVLTTTDGTEVPTSSLVGRPLLINFWYSTCEPCRREMPALAEAHEVFGDRVDFVGVNMSDPAIVAQNFADRYGVTFPILLDDGSAFTLDLGIAIAPTTLFVDEAGIIVEQVSGELTADGLNAHLTRLVGQ